MAGEAEFQESRSQTDAFFRGNICQRCIMIGTVEVIDFPRRDQTLLYAAQSRGGSERVLGMRHDG